MKGLVQDIQEVLKMVRLERENLSPSGNNYNYVDYVAIISGDDNYHSKTVTIINGSELTISLDKLSTINRVRLNGTIIIAYREEDTLIQWHHVFSFHKGNVYEQKIVLPLLPSEN